MGFKKIQGLSMQGFSIGELTPLDYDNLPFWYRPPDGVSYIRGTSANGIRDLSGNGRHLTGGTGASVVNTAWGSPFKGVGSGTPSTYGVTTDTSFLVNGSPYTVFLVINSVNASTVGSNYIGANINMANPWRFSPGAASITRVMPNVPNTAVPLGSAGNHIICDVNYGYAYGANCLKTYVDGVLRATASYTGNPTGLTTSRLTYGALSPHLTYEWFAYNNTGKSIAQIDFERDNLLELYLKKRYKNFY
jgi:hypothetical protein